MGWRDVLRRYGPVVVSSVIDAYFGKAAAQPTPAQDAPAPVPAVQPLEPVTPVAAAPLDVDLRSKWRGTIDRMAIDELGYPLKDEREIYDLAKLLEDGRADEVVRDLKGKK